MGKYLGGPPPSPLLQMSRYHLGFEALDGTPTTGPSGKMVRPAICLALCEALGGSLDDCLPAAAALELIHRTSLIFDDIQDHSLERNHQPTLAAAVGVERAINVGLTLSCYSRLVVNGLLAQGIDPRQVLSVHELLEEAVIGLCLGQEQDLVVRPATLRDYEGMVRLKTGALLGAGCRIGALLADSDNRVQEAAAVFGEALGVAFQFQDDYLGIWGDAQVVGKTANDLVERKLTLPVVLGIEKSPSLAELLADEPDQVQSALEEMGIPHATEKHVAFAAETALIALQQLALKPQDLTQFEELVSFVATRAT